MGDPTVRAAVPSDIDAILDLAARAWRATYGDVLREETIESALAEWYDRELTAEAIERDDVGYFVAVDDGLAGYVSGKPNEDDDRATLAAIYVDPERWGEGIGSALLSRFEQFCRERGCEAIELHAISENEVGTSFYRARGFEAVEEERTELFGEETTETLFRRPVEQ